MKNYKLAPLIHAFGMSVYIVAVALILNFGDKIFGKMDNLLGPIAFLMLFVLSAAVVGALLLGKPLMMYLDGQKKEAIKMFGQTIMWFCILLVIIFLIQFAVSAC